MGDAKMILLGSAFQILVAATRKARLLMLDILKDGMNINAHK